MVWKTLFWGDEKYVFVHFRLFPHDLQREHEKWQQNCKQRGHAPHALLHGLLPASLLLFTEKITVKKKKKHKKTRAQVVINPTGWASLPWHVWWRPDIKWNLRYALVCWVLGVWDESPAVSLWNVWFAHSVKALCFSLPVQGFDPFLFYWARRGGWNPGVYQQHSVLIKQSLCFLSVHCVSNVCILESSEGGFPLSFHRRSTKMWDLSLRTVSWVQCQWITLNNPS